MSHAEETLREVLDKILDERCYFSRDVKVKGISSGGANYTSALFIAEVTAPNREELKLFAKVAFVNDEMRMRMNASWLYETERFVYNELVKIYEDIQEKCEISKEQRYVFPKCYGINDEFGKETVVMENLIESGYKSYNRFISMDWDHARVSVENLAKFHALSFAFEKYFPEKYNKVIPNMKFRLGAEEIDEAAKPVYMKILARALGLLKEEQKEIVQKYITDQSTRNKYNRAIGKPVISHGDFRMSNMLYRNQGDKLEVITVDYQTVHAGCPVGDLVYFIFMGSDEDFRRQYYQKTLDHYYTSLCESLERLNIDAVEVYPREKFESDLKQVLPQAILIGVMILPIVTVEAESAPRVDGDADITEFIMEPNELYAQRFRGLVNDCLALGALDSI